MNRILMRLSLYIPIFIFGTGSLLAPPSLAATDYTLKELCTLAVQSAEQIRISRDDVEIAKEDHTRALSVLIPRATAFGHMKMHSNPDMINQDIRSHGVQLNQSFTLNGKEIIALRVAKETIKEKAFVLQAVTDAYLLRVSDAFFNILSSQRMLEIARDDVQRLKKHRSAVKKKLKVGEVTKTALYRAEAELSGARTELVRAENGLGLARAYLKNLIPMEKNFILSENGLSAFRQFLPSLEELKAQALELRPEIASAGKILEIAKKTIRYNKSAYWPSVAIEGSYSNNRIEYDNPTDITTDFEETSIAATLNFTIFDGGLRDAEIRQAMARKRQAKEALSSRIKLVELEVEKAWLAYKTATSVLTTLKDELKSAQENYNAVEMQFRYGMADSVDMMDANTLLAASERKLSDADYKLTLSVLEILFAKGEITRVLAGGTFLEQIN